MGHLKGAVTMHFPKHIFLMVLFLAATWSQAAVIFEDDFSEAAGPLDSTDTGNNVNPGWRFHPGVVPQLDGAGGLNDQFYGGVQGGYGGIDLGAAPGVTVVSCPAAPGDGTPRALVFILTITDFPDATPHGVMLGYLTS